MQLIDFIKSMPMKERIVFADKCGTTIGYLTKAICRKQKLGANLCVEIEKNSMGAVTCEEIRGDVDWGFLRNTKQTHHSSSCSVDV